VPRMRATGVDVVVVAAHSGATTSSSYGDALPFPENASTLVAQQVPGIDAILVGHAHLEIRERRVVNEKTGREVVLTEPLRWGMRPGAQVKAYLEKSAEYFQQVTGAGPFTPVQLTNAVTTAPVVYNAQAEIR